MLTLWQNVDQEPADELVSGQRHGLVPSGTFRAVIFDAERDTARVHSDQAAVGDGDTVRVA